MIYLKENKNIIYLPKLLGCDPEESEFQLIIQNRYTKQTIIYEVNDLDNNPLRYKFEIDMDYCTSNGEFEYFLVTRNDWKYNELNTNIIKNTQHLIDATALNINNEFIIYDNFLVVVNNFKSDYVDEDGNYTPLGIEGDICKTIYIWSRGLARYNHKDILPSKPKQINVKNKEYIQPKMK